MSSITRRITEHPVAVALLALAITVLALSQVVDLRTGTALLHVDPSLSQLRSSADPEQQRYERARKLFGSDDALFMGIHTENIFTAENLQRVVRITNRLSRLDGVVQVLSLATATDIWTDGDLIEIGPLLDRVPSDAVEIAELRNRVRDNPIYGNWLVSDDGRSTVFLISLRSMSDDEYLALGLDPAIAAIADEEAGPGNRVWITGGPHLKVFLRDAIVRNLQRIVPLVVLVMGIVPLLAFRSLLGVAVPVLTIVVSLVWTLGIVGALGQSLNQVTSIVPMLILTVGFAYALHVVSAYFEVASRNRPRTLGDRIQVAREALGEVGVAVMVTGLTTAAAFVSLTLSPLGAVREFGSLAVLGVLLTVAVSLTVTPALLILSAPRPPERAGPEGRRFDRIADLLANLSLRYRPAILVTGVALMVLSAIGAMRIQTNSDPIENFRPGSELREDYEAINERFGGATPFYIVLETDVPDAFMEPVNLEAVRSLQAWLEAQPEVGDAVSIVDYLMLLNRGLHEGDPAYLKVPESRRLAKQLFFFGQTQETEALIDARYQVANIVVRTHIHDSAATRALVERIEARLEELPRYLHANVTGSVVLLSSAIDDISRSQAQSLGAAVFAIYGMLWILFSSWRVGLTALFPNILPIAIYFGLLGFSGISLNMTTSLVGCIALGIAVDDTIHYFVRFNTDAKRAANEQAATRSALRAVIRPVSYTTLALCAGFLTLLVSEFPRTGEFGVLASFTLAAAWLVDVTLTPALCSGLRIVTLWDVLTLDLGPSPHRSIPLFEGLNLRQARIVALMSSIEEHRAGTRLFREGEEGREMYAIIEGTLVGSVTRNGTRVEVAKMTRGEVVGEVGLFAQRRSLDVRTESDCRLLSLTWEDLERLRRRSPRIAARVYRNLNQIQARRLIQNAGRMGSS